MKKTIVKKTIMKKSIISYFVFMILWATVFAIGTSSNPVLIDSRSSDNKGFKITPEDIPNTGILFVDHEKNNRSGHTPQPLIECKNGDIIAFYTNTWAETLSGHSCAGWSSYRRSTDGGKTWSYPVDLEYSKNIWDGAEIFSALVFGLVAAPNGTLIATVVRYENHRWLKQLPPVYLLSYDHGQTWTEPREFDKSATVDDIAVTYGACFVNEGEVFIVFNGDARNMSVDSQMPHSMYVSSDNGESFSKRSVLPFDGANFYETAAALDNGDIIVYTYPWRGHRGETDEFNMEYVISKDMGHTWSEVRRSYFAKAIRNPQMSGKTGDFYFMHGRSGSYGHGRPAHDGDPGRQNFVLYSSRDGINWDEGILLMSREVTPGGGDSYSGNTIIGKYDPKTPERLLIQADISYRGPRTNIHHWWVDVQVISPEYPLEIDFGLDSQDKPDSNEITVIPIL